MNKEEEILEYMLYSISIQIIKSRNDDNLRLNQSRHMATGRLSDDLFSKILCPLQVCTNIHPISQIIEIFLSILLPIDIKIPRHFAMVRKQSRQDWIKMHDE